MSPSPRGGTMLVLCIVDLRKVTHSINLHTNIIYYIYYKRGNPPKPTETHLNQLIPTYTNLYPPKPTQAQRDPFAMLYLCIVIHGKCAQSRTHPEGLAL